jgi:hypothetical protein
MPNKRNPRKHKRTGKAVSTKRNTLKKKRRRSKVKGGTNNNTPQDLKFFTDVNSDDEAENKTGNTFVNLADVKKKNNGNDSIMGDDETETPSQFNPPKITPTKAGMGIGVVALVGGVAALLMLAN